MKNYRNLNIKGVVLDKAQLENYLEKMASDHILQSNSSKDTYPIPKMKENFEIIEEVYNLLNEHIKLGIPIHPAGEWLLDNFYMLEETYQTVIKEMPLKKYTNFLGISNGTYKGFARIYVLAAEIVAYTDNKIETKVLSDLLNAYQKKKTLSMEEIWNIGIFIQIALIQNIKDICEKIYFSQMQKYRVENILERLVENKQTLKYKNLGDYKQRVKGYGEMKYPFIEYMSYRLKKYGKAAYPFINILEEQVNKLGTSIDEVVRKEHFDLALKKVSMANSITSIKELLRMDFMQIFQTINGVEEILKKDPANVYNKMDYKTKEYYRNKVKEISLKTKISEIYIANKLLELCNRENLSEKQKHVGYYLIGSGQQELINKLLGREKNKITNSQKAKLYVSAIWILSILINIGLSIAIHNKTNSLIISILFFIISLIPIQEVVVQLMQYVLGKIVKPKFIPKLDMQAKGVSEEYATFVVIPTILKSKEKVSELMKKLEIYYLANKSENIYFALLGDCSSGPNKEEKFDEEVINEGIKQVELLNKKYPLEQDKMPKFNFIYRKRFWNGKEECYLGWERKRGLLNQFNEYLLGNEENVFKENTIEKWKKENGLKKIPIKIKYIITLDSDTELVLNTGLELIGAMAHILNKPELNKNNNVVTEGHALIQPRVGVNLDSSRKNLFTKIFAGSGGVDSYTNAISDTYQDNFEEGIFTGKGIYDLEVFSTVLKNEIPENTVLSHDLLEGSYLRCGLATDIMLMDGYPYSYASFKARLHRWIRGDFQICSWVKNYIIDKKEIKKKNPLSFLSRYKILDNLIRAILPISITLLIIGAVILNTFYKFDIGILLSLAVISVMMSTIIDIINKIIFRKEGNKYQKNFEPTINSFFASILRGIISLGVLPDKAYMSLDAIARSIYRMKISNKHLLEWTTSEDAEKLSKTNFKSYYINMLPNVILGIFTTLCGMRNILFVIIGLLWLITPSFMWYISRKENEKNKLEELSKQEQEYLLEIGKRTWQFFKDNINEENNFLPPDNYQEDRKPLVVSRTSSTNIGLGLLAVVSSYDLGYENLYDTLELLNKMLQVIEGLPKWNGHLYNWYNTKTLEPLIPRYISTVDSGNFISYIYVLKSFYIEAKQKIIENHDLSKEEKEKKLLLIPYWVNKPIQEIPIANADFTKLYDEEKRLFSIGFNIEDNKLTPSYYDLLASEARGASFVAIAKRDVPAKHWYNLNRTLTVLNGYKGLISWSGTVFEYLMPNINMKKYKGSLLDESYKFMLSNQKEYAKKLGIPWGFSETAFNMKDLNNNYQYKAIGIPWLGLKRGLEDDIVVASYASALAVTEEPKEVIKNLKELEKYDMYNKYGFYESVDYTPIRLGKGKKYEPVKTYMAHHQALILLSINNLFKGNILQKRFHANPELDALDILLQEKMPENMLITKEEKKKPEKIKYIDYENYAQRTFNKVNEKFNEINAISNEKYLIVMDQKGNGYSKYKDILVNKFKPLSDETQGIVFYLKNIKNKRIWTSNYMNYLSKPDKYEVTFSEDVSKIKRTDGGVETITKVTTAQEEPVEIRNIQIKNNGLEDEVLEITSYIEPVLSEAMQDYAHPAFNKLFLSIEQEKENVLVVKRRKCTEHEKEIYMAVSLCTRGETVGEIEYEVDKEKFQGRGNLGLPVMAQNSRPFSKSTNLVLSPIIAMKQTVRIKPEETANLSLIIAVSEEKEEVINAVEKYSNYENINKCFELSRARVEAEARYLGINNKDIETYQKMLSFILYQNPIKKTYLNKLPKNNYPQSELWKYGISGDLPIVLVKISGVNDIYVLEEVLKAYEFYRTKNIQIDLVILDEEENNYERYVKEEIINSILNKNLSYMQNINGGIFVIDEKESMPLLEFKANIIIDSSKGSLARQLKDLEEEYLENIKEVGYEVAKEPIFEEEKKAETLDVENLKYYNEYGGFSKDGKEYVIKVNKENRLPTVWSHVMANEKFGTLVTESLGGFTWSKNSRLNKISAWSNDQVLDIPSEIIYMQEKTSLNTWSLGLNPMPDNNDYIITYGFGYAKYEHTSMEIKQELNVFIPIDDSIKVNLLNLKNLAPKKKKIKLVYYVKPVLGEDEVNSNGYIELESKESSNTIILKNRIDEKEQYTYISSSEKIGTYTGDKNFFIGNGSLSNPEALKKVSLNNENSLGADNIVAIQVEVELEAFETKEISFVLGMEDDIVTCLDNSYKYSKIQKCINELENVKKYWENFTQKLQVNTPVESFNILINGWLSYQSLVCRLWARSGFYQSGGAFGFRDQLQDTLGLKYYDVNLMKQQIIKHSKHQFIEGDVEHWWHEEISRGIRTRFSDDLLWLVYVVCEYIKQTGDYSILEIETSYKKGETLEEGVDERYELYEDSEIKESIYMHCIRAIERALNFGEHGLPKMGSGDWNDGMNTVGNKGRGESVWLGFFLYDILSKFIEIVKQRSEVGDQKQNVGAGLVSARKRSEVGDQKSEVRSQKQDELILRRIDDCLENTETEQNRIERYKQILEKLKKALNTAGWDGRWYKRAFTDDGDELGSLKNEECKIDGISQSWATISNAGDNDKKYISMESLENHLIDNENGIIKLLDPPFEKSKLDPGYIKAYLPGTRENGGQYTHGAIWTIIAESILGFGEKAVDLFRIINPIEHSKTKEAANKYKVEPYVITADVYGHENLAGRGGWTWYTGSSSWFLKAGIEYILGLKIEDNMLSIEPCIASNWKEYSIRYKYGTSIYNIKVKNPNNKNTGVEKFILNGSEIETKKIKIQDDGKVYDLEVIM